MSTRKDPETPRMVVRPVLALVVLTLLICSVFPKSSFAADEKATIADPHWKYNFNQPPPRRWMQPDFNDRGWAVGPGGFGTPDTPGARIGTEWNSPDIWLRREIELEKIPDSPALLIHHDENAEVFLNGQRVAQVKGYVTEYKVIPLKDKAAEALKQGTNLLAVHCHQTGGGQFIDVHVIDANHVPTLPEPEKITRPKLTELITKWGSEVTADNAWTEYPRPQLARNNWTNLNGHWDYAITDEKQQDVPGEWDGKILVPYALESRLSGVQRLLDPEEALWYHRTFEWSERIDSQSLLLNFEAVDYECDVWVNDNLVGSHKGGNDPFSFDISSAVRQGNNTLLVRVKDDTEAAQLRGKQVLSSRGIWYTRVSGIWQTVWLEAVPKLHVQDLKIDTDVASGTIRVKADLSRPLHQGEQLQVTVHDGDKPVEKKESRSNTVEFKLDSPRLWSPSSPHLYQLEIAILNGDGTPVDRVESYAGIRSVGKKKDAAGHWRFTLNGEFIFHWGTLDQGWWPDGLLTPPSDEAMLFDIEYLQAAGFNMIRKHIKVEPRRYYYHCDRLGMLVWQDQVSGGEQPKWTRLEPNPEDAEWAKADHEQFMEEFERMIDNLENHPSIVVWTPFNERWGQHQTMEVGQWTVERDPSRHVNIASGGNFWPIGDIVDDHNYPHPDFHFQNGRFDPFIKVIGEFGGHGYPVEGHLWDPNNQNWGYGGLPQNREEYRQRYLQSLEMLNDFRRRGIAGGVYTQTTDVEGEINGLITYDRKVIKIPAGELQELHGRLFEPLPETTKEQ
ncbi:glycoside hydrolase family 2 protein [Rubinisphaera margarita]|uniref:glycoside hydrolase family 2 protein n=1 Tax=Rubinisphaera margarita TaxID=2909586 RepID=UPI001EE88FCB|nr:sugar-binding domain-containing protein [Rubinisphaera margarita]MCG6156244.1 hypothetical protein [Rubinisphaera margarita]